MKLTPLKLEASEDRLEYTPSRSRSTARGAPRPSRCRGPEEEPPADAEALRKAGAEAWHLRLFRELEDALFRLRFNERRSACCC